MEKLLMEGAIDKSPVIDMVRTTGLEIKNLKPDNPVHYI
jgi:hypothetical protein